MASFALRHKSLPAAAAERLLKVDTSFMLEAFFWIQMKAAWKPAEIFRMQFSQALQSYQPPGWLFNSLDFTCFDLPAWRYLYCRPKLTHLK